MAKIRVQKGGIPVTLTIDGQAIEATITRFNTPGWAEFMRSFRRTQEPLSERQLQIRKPDEDWSVPDAEIRRRRLRDMDDTQRAEYERLAREDEAFALTFLVDTLSAHVTLKPGQVQIVDEDTEEVVDVTTGAEFVRAFGGRQDVLIEALRAIAAQRDTTSSTPAA